MLYIGTADSVEEALARRAGIPFRPIESGQLRGMAPWVALYSLMKMARGVRQVSRLLAEFRPNVAFVTGGFVAAPVVWASWRAGVPVFIYLPDMAPGLAIRNLSRFARRVAVSFPEVAAFFPGKAVVTGYPVRPEIQKAAAAPQAARRKLGLAGDLPVLLAFGGSRGARSINRALTASLSELLPHCQVLHVSGTLDWPAVEKQVRELPEALRHRYHPYPYLHDEMPLALAAADLVVARAGASTLGEFPAAGLPSILVPYPYSGQHQELNADCLVQHGAALKVADADLPARLVPTVLGLLNDPTRLAAMGTAARAMARPQAAERIALELYRVSSQ